MENVDAGGRNVVDLLNLCQETKISALAKVILSISFLQGDTWECSVDALVCICKEGRDAVRSALHELESSGYLHRYVLRQNGRFSGYTYVFNFNPCANPNHNRDCASTQTDFQKSNKSQKPFAPKTAKPATATPVPAPPKSEGHNSNIYIDDRLIDSKDISTYLSSNQSICQDPHSVAEKVRQQIDAEHLSQEFNKRHVADIVSLMVDVFLCCDDDYIAGKSVIYPTQYIQSCFAKIGPLHLQHLLTTIDEKKPVIKNPKGYFVKALVNESQSMDLGYDFAGLV